MRFYNFLNEAKEDKFIPSDIYIDFMGEERLTKTEIDKLKVEDKSVKNARGEIKLRHFVQVENDWLPVGRSEFHLSYESDRGWVGGKIHVEEEMRGKGIALVLIKIALSQIQEPMTTTGVHSDMGKGLLKSLVRKGLADKEGDNYIIHMKEYK